MWGRLIIVAVGLAALYGCDEEDAAPRSTDAVVGATDSGEAVDSRFADAEGRDAARVPPSAPVDGGLPPSEDGGPGGDGGQVEPPPECVIETVVAEGVEIFAFEVSRADATAGSVGVEEGRLCSRAGVMPWTDITVGDAEAACQSAGFRLCTNEEWGAVCRGPDRQQYPYGRRHQPGVCNDHVSGGDSIDPTGSRPGCRTASGVYDLSGNVWEITSGPSRRGASYRVYASTFRAEAADCISKYVLFDDYLEDDLGFRCCRAGQ